MVTDKIDSLIPFSTVFSLFDDHSVTIFLLSDPRSSTHNTKPVTTINIPNDIHDTLSDMD